MSLSYILLLQNRLCSILSHYPSTLSTGQLLPSKWQELKMGPSLQKLQELKMGPSLQKWQGSLYASMQYVVSKQVTCLLKTQSTRGDSHHQDLGLKKKNGGLKAMEVERDMALELLFLPLMACLSAKNAFTTSLSITWRPKCGMEHFKPLMVCSFDRRDSHGSPVLKAATLLTPPTRFEASKLKVVFMGEEIQKQPLCAIPRVYTLTHCDFTANLTLSVSKHISMDQFRGCKTRLRGDDVVAEWKKVKGEVSLYVHCYVSGSNLLHELAAEFRYYIFSKELPLVLKAVVHGDSVLFNEHPELMDAKVWVYFHSNSKMYNCVECWGALRDAMQRTLSNRLEGSRHATPERSRKWLSHKAIFHALVSFVL